MSKLAFIFPGQGAQIAGMGKDFYEHSQTARDIMDEASENLKLDMKKLCFEENEKLHQTEYTQAAMVTVCMAMEQVLRERNLKPEVTAGLSLGEYCAIASTGGMKIQDAIWAVRKRGILMEHAVPGGKGAMAAVLGMKAEEVDAGIAGIEGVSVANYNCRLEGAGGAGGSSFKRSRSQTGTSIKGQRTLPFSYVKGSGKFSEKGFRRNHIFRTADSLCY